MRVLPLYGEEGPSVAVERVEPLALNSGCERCALGAKASKDSRCMSAAVVGAEGTPLLYVVGMGPTQQEDRTGMPFSGASGSYVRGLVAHKWDGQVMYDNALRCNLGRDKLKPTAIEACRGSRPVAKALGSGSSIKYVLGTGIPAAMLISSTTFCH